MSNKKWIITGTIAVAAVLAFIAVRGPAFGPGGTEGTIGAAKRYQSDQVTSSDISLDNPEVASFIQSDLFRTLAKNEAFREAARSESFNHFLTSDALREASAHVDMARTLENASVRELLKSDALAHALTDASMREAMARVDLAHLSENGRLGELLKTEAIRELAARVEFQQFADAAARGGVRTTADLAKLAEYGALKSSDAFRALESNRAFTEALQYGFLDLFRTPEGAKFAVDGLRQVAESRAFTEAMRLDGFKGLVEGMRVENLGAVRDIAGSAEMLSVLSNASFREAAAHDELSRVADVGMREALARVSE